MLLDKAKSGLSRRNYWGGSPRDGSSGTTPGTSPGNVQAKDCGVLSKAMLIALAQRFIGIGLLAERLG